MKSLFIFLISGLIDQMKSPKPNVKGLDQHRPLLVQERPMVNWSPCYLHFFVNDCNLHWIHIIAKRFNYLKVGWVLSM